MGDTPAVHDLPPGYADAGIPLATPSVAAAGPATVSPLPPPPPLSQGAPAAAKKLTLAQRWARFPSTLTLWPCLMLLTAVGGFLRFWRIDRQGYWTDEGHTVNRMQGTFTDMLANISGQGFPPGWYTLIRWWRYFVAYYTGSEGFSWSMGSLRLLPAFFGMLTVPAMYFLARQFTDRKGALLVALLAAVNPYLIYYSRDIKMYAPLWFFATLSTALFFHWLTTQRHWVWFPLYVLTAALTTAMHATGWIIIGLHVVFLLTRPRPKPLDAPLGLLGVTLASWMPIWWFLFYLRPEQWTSRIDASENNPGMQWFERFTDMSWQTLAGLPTIHIFGYLWPTYPFNTPGADAAADKDWVRVSNWFALGGADFEAHLATRSFAWMAQWQVYAAVILFSIMLLGLIPWRRFFGKRPVNPERLVSVTRGRWWWVGIWAVVPAVAMACTWIPPESEWYERVWGRGQSWLLLGYPKTLWEPRYMGIIVPAWLLWLAASLRRLPFVVLRAAAISFVAGVCTFSALSNHLTYRNAPFTKAMRIAMQYGDQADLGSLAMCVPQVAFQSPAMPASFMGARKVAPNSAEERAYPTNQVRIVRSEAEAVTWARTQMTNRRIKTIAMTERYGDVTDPANPLSDESMAKMLGPRWELKHNESYKWQYEWRYYIFHTWRTRVWQLVEDGGGAR